MKTILIILFSFAVWSSLSAQNVGINNTNPQTALDIEGRLRIRPALLTVTGATVTIPNGNTGYHTLSGTPGTDFTVTLPAGDAGSFLLIENTTANVATLTGLAKILPGKSRLLLRGNTDWILANDTESQLEKITEGANTGWRLLGRNPVNYGNIGIDAMDLSQSYAASTTYGATGTNSIAMGYYTKASGENSTAMGGITTASGENSTAMGFYTNAIGAVSTAMGTTTTASGDASTAMGWFTTSSGESSTAMGRETIASGLNSTALGFYTTARAHTSLAIGRFNDTIVGSDPANWVSTDPLLTIGNGTTPFNRSNAMTVYKNGTFDLQNLSSIPINSNNKFYVLNSEPYYSGKNLHSQLEKITEAGNTGWRIFGRNPDFYGNIGHTAVDLSLGNTFSSSIQGATELASTAMGLRTTASGTYSTAMGHSTIASGSYSTALGVNSDAIGFVSTTMGSSTTASGDYSTAMGGVTIASGEVSTAMGLRTTASGAFSTAMGDSTTAWAYTSLAIGRYNDIIAGSDPNNWVSTDPLLTIGNGSLLASPSNAMTVYKNGNTDLNGFVSLGSLADNAPRIKVKKITTTLNGSGNGSVAHVLNESKILDLQVKVTNSYGSLVFDGNSIGNNSFNAYIDAGNVLINAVAGNNGDIINRPDTITITYEE